MKTTTSLILACLLIGPSLCLASPEVQLQAQSKPLVKKHVHEKLYKNHYYEVRKLGKKWVYWRLVHKTKHEHVTGHVVYPYGKEMANGAGPIEKIGVIKFHALLKARLKALKFKRVNPLKKSSEVLESRLSARASTSSYTPGIPLGANESTGLVSSSANCYYATSFLSNSAARYSFNSSGAASSYASQTNIAASISANYETAFSDYEASDDFTYSDNYSSTGASGSVYFTAYQLYQANNTPVGLNANGTILKNNNKFSQNCGSYFVSTLPVGMLITGKATYSATTSEASTAIANSFSASTSSGDLSSFTAAVNAAYNTSGTASTNSFSFGFSVEIEGGGEGAAALYSQDLYKYNVADLLSACSEGVIASCTSFVSYTNAAALDALSNFQSYYAPALNTSNKMDLSGMSAFPNGIAGVTKSGLTQLVLGSSAGSIANSTTDAQFSDAFTSYKTQLTNYLTVLNQISTLHARAEYLGNKLHSISNASTYYNPTMDLSPYFSLKDTYFTPLAAAYWDDVTLMVGNLNTCLGGSSSATAAGNNCTPIIDAYNSGITSAYKWYSTTTNGKTLTANNFALQNSISLQYAGLIGINATQTSIWPNVNFPLDVVWASAFPDFGKLTSLSGLPSGVSPPSSLPGLIAFADQEFPFTMTGFTTVPYVMWIPASSSSISTVSTPITNYSTTNFNISTYGASPGIGWQVGSGGTGSLQYGNGCTYPTFTNLCSYTLTYTSPSSKPFPNSSISVTLGAISGFFSN